VTFTDTGETFVLKVRPGSACHFFAPFTVGSLDILLRLDWSDLDNNDQPTLDADFIDKKTGKHCSLKGKRHSAHHTNALPGKSRCYEWEFDTFSRRFTVEVVWRADVSDCLRFSDSAEVFIHRRTQTLKDGLSS
jgi:hypothetical protein